MRWNSTQPPVRVVFRVLFGLQRVLLRLSFGYFSLYYRIFQRPAYSWVIGVHEIAAINRYISISIPKSFSVNFKKNPYYDFKYDREITGRTSFAINLKRVIYGPIWLGQLTHLTDGFLYLWTTRFLISSLDEGEHEYRFLKSKHKKIVNYFVGSDIRSAKLTQALARERGDETEADYYHLIKPESLSDAHEEALQKRAAVAEKYADLIFTMKTDQASYFAKPTQPFLYFYPDDHFHKNENKFSGDGLVKIVHAPSSPVTKGTALVRAAITRLKREGYQLEYIELIGVPNAVVLRTLRECHIVLNEFYALVPGVFGVEALANYCALMTAADETIEPDLPAGSNAAWLPTKSYQVYDHLKFLLDHPDEQRRYAANGYEWAQRHAAQSSSGAALKQLLDHVGR